MPKRRDHHSVAEGCNRQTWQWLAEFVLLFVFPLGLMDEYRGAVWSSSYFRFIGGSIAALLFLCYELFERNSLLRSIAGAIAASIKDWQKGRRQ
jgi:hypothetical protein